LRVAREVGVTTITNTAPVPEGGIPESLIELTDILCANETEAEMLANKGESERISIKSVDDAKKAAAIVSMKYNIKNVIVTLGEKGSLWFSVDSNGEESVTHAEVGFSCE